MIKLKDILNEGDWLDDIRKDNDEIIRFLVGNAKELDSVPKTIHRRKEFKKTRDFTKELMKKIKTSGVRLKMGLGNSKTNTISYRTRSRKDMEELLKSGNLDKIDVEFENVPGMMRAIDKFGTSA